MIQLELTDQEGAILFDVIQSRVRELPREISHTDNGEFRRRLREEAETLEQVLARLAPSRAA